MDNSNLNANADNSILNNSNNRSQIKGFANESKQNHNDQYLNPGNNNNFNKNLNANNAISAKEVFNNKKNNEPISFTLTQTIGMIGRKLIFDKIPEQSYQFWDCVTKKDNWVISKSLEYNSRKKLVDFCKGSFLKAYPTNFDSLNYDCIKAWSVGAQIAAVNIQRLDDANMLLNMIFFKQNLQSGLVLKPRKLRDRLSEYLEEYTAPVRRLKITLISGYMLNMLGLNNLTNKFTINLNNLRLEIKLVGSKEDDNQKNNRFDLYLETNLLNPHFNNIVHTIDIYEADLAAIFINICSDKEIIGRSVIPICMLQEGIRSIQIYDNIGEEFKETRLIFMFEYEK